MSITPQAIKDQEFQSKFRGYDTIEVKAYLELLAEEFFELLEAERAREVKKQELIDENEGLVLSVEALTREKTEFRKEIEVLDDKVAEQQARLEEMAGEVERLKGIVANQKLEKMSLEDRLEKKDTRVKEAENYWKREAREKEILAGKLEIAEQQISALKKEEVDFKSTLGAAQKVANEVKRRSLEDARNLMENAKQDVKDFREAARKELERIPDEIEKLHQKRRDVKEALETILNDSLNNLNAFSEVEKFENQDDLNDLFQKIIINEDVEIEAIDLEKIEMDLNVPVQLLDEENEN